MTRPCTDCLHNDQGRTRGAEDRCTNAAIVQRHEGIRPRCNIERAEGYGFCGEIGFFFKDRRTVDVD